jgi:glycosyltransferase involved in cell wall biosynthesis
VRITYWTTAPLEPGIEAVSKEVFDLVAHFGGRVCAVSPHLSLKCARGGRILGFHPLFDPLLRIIVPALECLTDVSHVYAEISPWLFHKTLRRRPIVLTIASEKGEPMPAFLERCSAVVVQTSAMARKLESHGLAAAELSLIYPGVDLSMFHPRSGTLVRRPPKILLATFPRAAEELTERGVMFLLDVARSYPDVQFSVITRPWRSGSNAIDEVQRNIDTHRLNNVRLLEGVQPDMRSVYMAHDFTVIPYTTADGGKECPRSLVESLACGVPVLISEVAPFATFVDEHNCGRVFTLHPSSFAAALESALTEYDKLSRNAVARAHANFDLQSTLQSYSDIYDKVR